MHLPVNQEFTFQPPVVQAALFVSTATEGTFKHGIRRNGAEAPARVTLQQQSHFPVEFFAAFPVTEPFTIRRIAKEHTLLIGKLQGFQTLTSQVDSSLESCLSHMPGG